MRSLEWAQIQYDWCLYKTGKFRHRHIQKEDRVKTWRRWPLVGKPRRQRPLEKPVLSHFDLRQPAPRMVRK